MRVRRVLGLALPLLLVGGTPTLASTVTIAASGTWGSGAPTSNWSAPGDTWSFSITLPNPVPVSLFGATSNVVTTDFVSFSYDLNGNPVLIAPEQLIFFTTAADGGLEIDFNASGMDTTNGIPCNSVSGPCTFDLFGTQLFTGAPPSVTLQPGTSTSVDFDLTATIDCAACTSIDTAGTGTVTSFTVTSSTPEPATISLLAAGALGLFWKRKRA